MSAALMATVIMIKPEHFCADHDWAHLLEGDPRLATCYCTFERDTQERAREVWRASPGVPRPGDWGLRFGGASVGLSGVGSVSYVAIDEPHFESTIVRDLIQCVPMIYEGYVSMFHVERLEASTKMHYATYVAKTMNARIAGQRHG